MNTSIETFPVKLPEPLGLFLKVGHQDHTVISQVIAEGETNITGIVLDPRFSEKQEALKKEAEKKNMFTILDPKALELATPEGHRRLKSRLPWGAENPHTVSDFRGEKHETIIDNIALTVATEGYTATFAPCHYLENGVSDPWVDIDRSSVVKLRTALDELGRKNVIIYYTLSLPMKKLTDPNHRHRLINKLKNLPVNGIWLRVDGFGSNCGGASILNFIESCRDLHELNCPLVAERCGNASLPLLSFGAVSGAETSVSGGERFDFTNLRPLKNKQLNFGRKKRIYIGSLGIFLTSQQAEQLFSIRGMGKHICADTRCCKNGKKDMFRDTRCHLVRKRMEEIETINQTPPSVRGHIFDDKFLTSYTNELNRVLVNKSLPQDLRTRFENQSRHYERWRKVLLKPKYQMHYATFPPPLERFALRSKVGA